MKNKIVLFCCIIFLFCNLLHSATSLTYLNDSFNVRSFGMGGVYSGNIGGSDSVFLNPAGLSLVYCPEFSAAYRKGFLDTYYSLSSFAMPIKKAGTFAFGGFVYDGGSIRINYLYGRQENISAKKDTIYNIGWGINPFPSILETFFTGINIKYIESEIASRYKGQAFGIDLGIIYQTIDEKYGLSFLAKNISSGIKYKNATEDLPFVLRAGLSAKIMDRKNIALLLCYDTEKEENKIRHFGGFELTFLNMTSLRVGYNNKSNELAIGFGIDMKKFGFDYSYNPLSDINDLHRVSINMKFGKVNDFSKANNYYQKGLIQRAKYLYKKVDEQSEYYSDAQTKIKEIEDIEYNNKVERARQEAIEEAKILQGKGINIDDNSEILKFPPQLFVTLSFVNDNGNSVLEAEENGAIVVRIENKGKGAGADVKMNLATSGKLPIDFILSETEKNIGTILPGETKIEKFDIRGGEALTDGEVMLKVNVLEKRQFNAEPAIISFKTTKAEAPVLVMKEFNILDDSYKKIDVIESEKSGYIEVTVTNTGVGIAKMVKIILDPNQSLPEGFVLEKKIDEIGNIKPDEIKTMRFGYKTDENLKTSSVDCKVLIKDIRDSEAREFILGINTKQYDEPVINLETFSIDDDMEGNSAGNGNGAIEIGEQIEMGIKLKNKGIGKAENVKVYINNNSEGIILHNKEILAGDFIPGEIKFLIFSFSVTNGFNGNKIEFELDIKDRRNKFYWDDKISLDLKEKYTKLNVKKLEEEINLSRIGRSEEVKSEGVKIEPERLKAMRERGELNIAVIDFKPIDLSENDAMTMTELLRTEFVQHGIFRVLDRSNMDKILAEQGFQMTGCTEGECTVKIGKILNVKMIISGQFSKMGGKYIITAKVSAVETGDIIVSKTSSAVSLDPDIIQNACKELVTKIEIELIK